MEKIVQQIVDERKRQKEVEGWLPEHDDKHKTGELALAAACYAGNIRLTDSEEGGSSDGDIRHVFVKGKSSYSKSIWPWDSEWDKRDKHSRKKQLVIAGALIVAELERLERQEFSTTH